MIWHVIVVGVAQGLGGLLAWRLLRWAITRGFAYFRGLIDSA